MAEKKLKRIARPATPEERKRHDEIRQKVMQEFPPAETTRPESPPGIPSQIRRAREARGLTWHALAKLAGVPSADVVRDIEYGRDTPISAVQSLAKALGLRLELVEEPV
jgi:ribosome-binding protein aMBF1 (putative translation factor)